MVNDRGRVRGEIPVKQDTDMVNDRGRVRGKIPVKQDTDIVNDRGRGEIGAKSERKASSGHAQYLPDDPSVTFSILPVDRVHTAPVVDVPEFQCTVQRAAHNACRVKLEAGHRVLMSHQRPQTCSLIVPHLSITTQNQN